MVEGGSLVWRPFHLAVSNFFVTAELVQRQMYCLTVHACRAEETGLPIRNRDVGSVYLGPPGYLASQAKENFL